MIEGAWRIVAGNPAATEGNRITAKKPAALWRGGEGQSKDGDESSHVLRRSVKRSRRALSRFMAGQGAIGAELVTATKSERGRLARRDNGRAGGRDARAPVAVSNCARAIVRLQVADFS